MCRRKPCPLRTSSRRSIPSPKPAPAATVSVTPIVLKPNRSVPRIAPLPAATANAGAASPMLPALPTVASVATATAIPSAISCRRLPGMAPVIAARQPVPKESAAQTHAGAAAASVGRVKNVRRRASASTASRTVREGSVALTLVAAIAVSALRVKNASWEERAGACPTAPAFSADTTPADSIASTRSAEEMAAEAFAGSASSRWNA